MKLLLYNILLFCLIFFNTSTYAQIYQNGWSFGFGGAYPRFISVTGDGYSANTNFGGYLSLARDFSERISFRLKGGVYHLESVYFKDSKPNTQKVNAFVGDLDLIYNLLPCEPVSPFVLAGGGFVGSKSQNSFDAELNDFWAGYELNLGLGAFWRISDSWKVKTEINYHTLSNNKLDGNYSINEQDKGILGGNGDTYMTFELGLEWQFSKGEKSTLCDRCPEGIREIIKIDTIYKQIPKEVIKIQKDTIYQKSPMLFNVNFNFDKSNIRVESYPILNHAISVLNENPDMKVVISGHTDSMGSDEYNIKLSRRRVDAVYNFLVGNGISADRISEEAYGESKPIKENNSSINRAFNRRVEFRIIK